MKIDTKKIRTFLDRKNIDTSAKVYFKDALSMMSLGLYSTLLIGIILKSIGEQSIYIFGQNAFSDFFIEIGIRSMELMGAAIGVSVAWALKSPPLVLFSSIITGSFGALFGGPAAAFVAAIFGSEFGKAISKETKVDIIVTPIFTIMTGIIFGKLIGSVVGKLMIGLGNLIMISVTWNPFLFGIFIAVIVGMVLTAPISSAALCIMLNLSGIAAGAATVGCSAQMIGFAVISYKENGVGGLISQGMGTSMLQISNIIKNPWILLPPTLTGAILGPVSTLIFKMENNSIGAGMGTSGFIGQICTFTSMGYNLEVFLKVLLLHFILPGILSIIIYKILYKSGKIKFGDCKLEI